MAVESTRSLRAAMARASAFAEQGRIMKGYRELLEGLATARDGPLGNTELKAVLWYAAIEMYETRWFPDEWLPLVKQSAGKVTRST